MQERRRNTRFNFYAQMRIHDGVEEKWADVDVSDISRSGIGFSCDQMLMLGQTYEFNLRIWSSKVIEAHMRIVRGHAKDVGYNYGATFVDLSAESFNEIGIYETSSNFDNQYDCDI